MTLSLQPVSTPTISPSKTQDLKEAAVALEAAFLTEMLKAAGFGKAPDSFNGGAGEDQFMSFQVRAQAEAMAEAGGIGLAEALFNALKERENDV